MHTYHKKATDSVFCIYIQFVPNGKLRDGRKWYGYGLVSIEGNMYQFISHCGERYDWGWFDGTQLIWRLKGQEGWGPVERN